MADPHFVIQGAMCIF